MNKIPGQAVNPLGLFSTTLSTEQRKRIELWIARLRRPWWYGGDHKSVGGLFNNNSHRAHWKGPCCVLGVALRANPELMSIESGAISLEDTYVHLGLQTPNGVMNVEDPDDVIMPYLSLTALNDHHDWTFKDLAQLLEDQLGCHDGNRI